MRPTVVGHGVTSDAGAATMYRMMLTMALAADPTSRLAPYDRSQQSVQAVEVAA
jgi:hypothetical protein